MNLQKFYLQQNSEFIENNEIKFDFILEMTNAAAARSLDNLCRLKTKEISSLREKNSDPSITEKHLREYRDYAAKILR